MLECRGTVNIYISFFIKTYPVFSETSQDFFYDSNLNSPSNQLNQKQSDISNYANFIGYSYKEAKIDYNLSFFSYNSQSQALSQSHFHPTTTNNFHGYNYSAATAFLNPLFNLGFLATLANNNYILPAASLAFLALSFGAFVTANDVFMLLETLKAINQTILIIVYLCMKCLTMIPSKMKVLRYL